MAHMVFCVRNKKEMEAWKSLRSTRSLVRKSTRTSRRRPGRVDRPAEDAAERVPLAALDSAAQQFLVEQMEQFFFGEGSALPQEFVPPTH